MISGIRRTTSMKVHELIKELSQCESEAEVGFYDGTTILDVDHLEDELKAVILHTGDYNGGEG
jgi:hypothetical protein